MSNQNEVPGQLQRKRRKSQSSGGTPPPPDEADFSVRKSVISAGRRSTPPDGAPNLSPELAISLPLDDSRHSPSDMMEAPFQRKLRSTVIINANSNQEMLADINRASKMMRTSLHKGSCYGRFAHLSRRIVEHSWTVAFTTLLTVYALIGDDLRLITTNKPDDPIFNFVVILCLVVFTAECVLSCIGKDDYYFSFFFWLDVVSTGSLVLDISYVSEEMQGGGDEDGDMSNLRGGRTARVGAKAGRVVRVIRLVRILKLYKAYYEAQQRKKDREKNGPSEEDDWEDWDTEDIDPEELNRESRVGKKLGEITIRRVIILVLTMLLVYPFLMPMAADQNATSAFYAADNVYQTFRDYVDLRSAVSRRAYENAYLKFFFYHNWFTVKGYCPSGETCASQYYAHAFWIGIAGESQADVQTLADLARVNRTTIDRWISDRAATDSIYHYGSMPSYALDLLSSPWNIDCRASRWKRLGISLLKDKADDISYAVPCPSLLRIPEKKKIFARLMTVAKYKVWHFDFYFDLRKYSRQDAVMNLSTTGFICFVLCVAAMSFSTDANNLVLIPVENMIKRVEEIRENPLIAMKLADEEFKAEEIKKARRRRKGKARFQQFVTDAVTCKLCKYGGDEPMETVILEKTIIKLGSLLALGFGEAGANIIGANMRGHDSAGVNAMIAGQRVDCILGNVKIQAFSTATEVLRSKIMTFVNQIAEIVHGVVDEYYGAANKNNGDEFLIVWRLEALTEEEMGRLAEMSVVSFANILGALHRSPIVAAYRVHPGLQQRLGSCQRVNVSLGLHCGWSIEGAVGSEFKIDASYLSPNVSIAKSIQQATITYGVLFIVAESVVVHISEKMLEQLRLIDKVVIIGSPLPMSIYSLDLDVLSVPVDKVDPHRPHWTSQRRFRARQLLETEKAKKWDRKTEIMEYFTKDRVINIMRKRYTTEFAQLFNMGYQNYCQGEWAVARRMLASTQTMLGGVEDGPSTAILRFMEGHQFSKPQDWQGVRHLGSTDAET